MKNPTVDQFLKDIQDHSMEVLLDNGVYRHLKFSKENSRDMSFELVTYPGYLVISGDMGTYVFNRLIDMFFFFGSKESKKELEINPNYWAEKVQAASCYGGGISSWDSDKFKENVKEEVEYFIEDRGNHLPKEEVEELKEWIEEEVYSNSYEEWDAIHCINNLSFDFSTGYSFDFTDFWEKSNESFTYHYIWCCYAIVWGINKYREEKLKNECT